MNVRVCHLTCVHPRYDTRIFHKECLTLKDAGYDVTLIVADGEGDEEKKGIRILDVGRSGGGRLGRMTLAARRVFRRALALSADLYHFHDPELIPTGLKLKRVGKKVIYDVHEDYPRQMMNKPYLPRLVRPFVGRALGGYETFAARRFDAVVAATPRIAEHFRDINPRSVCVCNFPLLDELKTDASWEEKERSVCYVGGISKIRGIVELVKALELVDVVLHLAGRFESDELEKEVMSLPGWRNVVYHGFVGRDGVRDILSRCRGGIVTFHPCPNHLESRPNKLFEYLAAGLPVVASDFPSWREIVEENRCGVCVDPLSPRAVADGIRYLLEDDAAAERMGKNGRRAVEERFNWEMEGKKLVGVYGKILGGE